METLGFVGLPTVEGDLYVRPEHITAITDIVRNGSVRATVYLTSVDMFELQCDAAEVFRRLEADYD